MSLSPDDIKTIHALLHKWLGVDAPAQHIQAFIYADEKLSQMITEDGPEPWQQEILDAACMHLSGQAPPTEDMAADEKAIESYRALLRKGAIRRGWLRPDLEEQPLEKRPELILCDLNEDLVAAWQETFADVDGVQIEHKSILEIACDALVSPGNSFGYMDGGIDKQYLLHFGPIIQHRLQNTIRQQFLGELLVGQAAMVGTMNAYVPWLIAAPTMRVPMRLPAESINAYMAMRAILLIHQHGQLTAADQVRPARDIIRRIAIPGLGTGVGGLEPLACARQMRTAYDDVFGGPGAFPNSWREAQAQHLRIAGSIDRDMQEDASQTS